MEDKEAIRKGLILTGGDAALLSNALAEVKTKIYEKFEVRVDDTQALHTLISCFRDTEKNGRKKDATRILPLKKALSGHDHR